MTASINDVLDEREETHGDFRDVSDVYYALQNALYQNGFDKREYIAVLDMLCMKMARIVSGDPTHEDHWIDLGGYSEIGRRIARHV